MKEIIEISNEELDQIYGGAISHGKQLCKITCACGNVFYARSTKEEMRVDICSSCHPFFTGKQKLVEPSGRIDKFKKRLGN